LLVNWPPPPPSLPIPFSRPQRFPIPIMCPSTMTSRHRLHLVQNITGYTLLQKCTGISANIYWGDRVKVTFYLKISQINSGNFYFFCQTIFTEIFQIIVIEISVNNNWILNKYLLRCRVKETFYLNVSKKLNKNLLIQLIFTET
jgi:hypothetical protein